MANEVIVPPELSDFYVYTLAYPNGRVFYVGKGRGYRISGHEREARTGKESHKCHIIRKIWREGGQVVKTKVATSLSEQEAFSIEMELIKFYGRANLANLTDGGEGTTAPSLLSSFVEDGVTYLSFDRTCQLLNMSRSGIARAIREGRINVAFRGKRRCVYFTQTEVERFQFSKIEEIKPSVPSKRGIKRKPRVISTSDLVDEGSEYLNRQDAAELLGVNVRTVDRYANEGHLPRYYRGFRRIVFFKRSDLERLQAERETLKSEHQVE